jgi:hypothetical protein
MIVNFESALAAFSRLPSMKCAPSLHPAYIVADSKRDSALRPLFFVHEENGEIYYHGFHLSRIPETDFFDIQSPYGYGGPVSSTNDSGFIAAAWSKYADWCRENRVLVEFMRFHPVVGNGGEYSGAVQHDRETVLVDLTKSDLLAGYETRARTAVRKAEKSGLTVEWRAPQDSVVLFSKIYNDAMANLNAPGFYRFSEAYFEALFEWGGVHLGACVRQGEVVGGALFLIHGKFLEYHLSGSTSAGKSMGAANLLLHEAFLRAKARGCTHAHLGGGSDRAPDNRLLFFKAGFSELRAQFKIGHHIFDLNSYAELKQRWMLEHGAETERILFYR